MADVFISYKREDRPRVQVLVDALTAEGVSVWWDVGIQGGSTWRHSIHEALEAAKCVIVVWSTASVGTAGEFVHDEAGVAKARGVYLPVTFDDVEPPLGFRQVQRINFATWNGHRADPSFASLLAAVGGMIGRQDEPEAQHPAARSAPGASHAMRKPVVAVLPFRFPPNDGDQAMLAEGLAEDVIIGLSRCRLLRVLPAQSSLTFDTQGLGAGRVCAALGVDYILQGQVRGSGSILRVSAHLSYGRTETSVWSDRYDRMTADPLGVQDEVAHAIVSTVEPAILAHEEATAFHTSEDQLSAWELFLRGRAYFWRGRRDDARKAREYLEKARAQHPDDAPTAYLLAYCALHDIWMGVERDPRKAIGEAHRLALEAVALDGSDAFAHYTLGVVLSMTGRIKEAFAEQHHALKLNPYLAAASGELARLLSFAGRSDEAIAAADEAIGASPNDPHIWLWLRAKALAHFVEQRYVEAAAEATNACVRRPDYYFLHDLLAACAYAAGDVERAHAALAEARRQMPHNSLAALKATHPFANPEHLERFVGALQAAGWDDGPDMKAPAPAAAGQGADRPA